MTSLEDYSFLAQAAAEARRESDRYWAGAGSKYPRYKNSGWYGPLPREVEQRPREPERDIERIVREFRRRNPHRRP